MNYVGLRKLLGLAEAFEQANGPQQDLDEQQFTAWLVARTFREADPAAPTAGADQPQGSFVAGYIAMLLGFMGQYATFYARRIFRRSVVYSLDDFGVLISLHPDRKLTKTETLKECRLEKSSGNEVLKRLLKQNLIRETDHPTDRRSKVIELTEQGREAFGRVWVPIARMSNVVAGDLTPEEQLLLLHLLRKLNRFHQPIFEQGKEEAVEQLLGLRP
ncbi:MAG: winged helix DNA-binding protein [Cytophagales bacterium]|nr:winged helix DNA-binding protein [Cytophagales bacterium]